MNPSDIRATANRDDASTARFKAREALHDCRNPALAALYEEIAGVHDAIADQPSRHDMLAQHLRDLYARVART